MIAVNVMDLDVEVIREEEGLSRVFEIFEKSPEAVLPVLHGDGRLVGVLWRDDLEAFLKGSAKRGARQGGPAMVAELVREDYIVAGPMATVDEIRKKLASASGEGRGEIAASVAFVYIVDGHGRLLGRVGSTELELREKAYEEAL
jgi:CBS domain-containing protein